MACKRFVGSIPIASTTGRAGQAPPLGLVPGSPHRGVVPVSSASVAPIIEGRKWVEDRLHHLHELLDAGPTEDERRLIEAEIAALQEEARRSRHGLLRWLWPGGRPRDI